MGFSSLPNTLAIIEYLLTHDEDAIALNTLLEQFDIKEGILIQEDDNDADLFSDAPLTPTEPPNLREMMSEKGVEIMRHVRNRQRRRMEKLNRFFGTTAPSEAQEVSMEDETLLKLGKHLQDAIDPDDFKRLLIEMQTNLKEKTERRSSQITREIRSATDLPVKDNLLKTKSPPLLRKVSPDSIQVHVDSENEHRTTGGQKITEESLKKGSPISSNKL